MPWPDVLYQLSVQLELPLEWLFSCEVSSGSETAVLECGNVMAELVRGRSFQIMDDVVLDGLDVVTHDYSPSAAAAGRAAALMSAPQVLRSGMSPWLTERM